MNLLTVFGASAVTVMLLSYALEHRSRLWVLLFALACAASSCYGWLAGTWPFGVVEGIWALVALRRWWLLRQPASSQSFQSREEEGRTKDLIATNKSHPS